MPDAGSELQDVAVLLAERRVELTSQLVVEFGERIPELPTDPTLVDLLNGSAGSNLENLAHLLRGHVAIADIRAPAAAVEDARRLAQRGTPPSALLRAYRLGQQLILRWAGEEIQRRVADPALALATSQLLTETSFQYIDAVSEDVIGAYQDERERWLANRSAVQRETVEALLRGERVDPLAAEAALGYRLRQHHLGVVLWTAGGAAQDQPDGLADSERVLGRVARLPGVCGQPLFVPRDRESAWGWLPVSRSVDVAALAVAIEQVVGEVGGGVGVALGVPEAGEAGFRATHGGALAAHRVALLGATDGVISFHDPTVRAAALLARDLPSTRWLVERSLGGLAEDNPAAARMRETLLAFVEDRESYVATAARLHLHKNTVKYRVDRALDVRGKPLGEERLDLELALVACRWLGPAVLGRAASSKNGQAATH